MIEPIIVAVDGSEHSLKALDYAGKLGEKFGKKLVLLYAYHPTSKLRGGEMFDKMVIRRKQAGERIIEEALSRLAPPSFEVEKNLIEGPAADAIISAAEARNADLIVMGSRGMGSFKRLLFGSVSMKVVQHAPCTVTVVR